MATMWSHIAEAALNYIVVSAISNMNQKQTVTDLKNDLRTTKTDLLSELKTSHEQIMKQIKESSNTRIKGE